MTDQETATALYSLGLAIADLQTRLTRIEAFALSIHRRMQLQEAGTALYEVQHIDRVMN